MCVCGGRCVCVCKTYKPECQFKCVSEKEIVIAIDNLENKSSTGYDGISNKLLKFINDVVTKPLTLILIN